MPDGFGNNGFCHPKWTTLYRNVFSILIYKNLPGKNQFEIILLRGLLGIFLLLIHVALCGNGVKTTCPPLCLKSGIIL